MSEKKRKRIIKWGIGLSLLSVVICYISYTTRLQVGSDRAEFERQYPNYFLCDIPDEADDFCYAYKKGLLMKCCLYSFVLNEEAYNVYEETVLKEYSVDISDENQSASGYAHWYGMKVSDVNKDDPDYILDDFPFGLPFEEVIEDDVNDYSILLYSPCGTGSRQFGILINDTEHRIVCYYAASIK